MEAIIKSGSQQFQVKVGQKITVNKIDASPDSEVALTVLSVLGDTPVFGTPVVTNAKVVAKVLEHRLGDKVISATYKRRKGYHKKHGHRQDLTDLKITEITMN